jgi:DNA-binding transcriptional MerR regulator
MEKALPAIPAKRYFTIGEVSELCGVKPYVLRYWEQEFTQLRPMKRRGNRRYYQHHEVLLIRRIRELLYEQGFTISGARNRLSEVTPGRRHDDFVPDAHMAEGVDAMEAEEADGEPRNSVPRPLQAQTRDATEVASASISPDAMRRELMAIRDLLKA